MTISFNNYAKKIGCREIEGSKQDWFSIQVFVEGSDDELDNIDYVEYELHPSIPNPYRPVADRSKKFAVNFKSWGIFTVRMTVRFKDGTEKTYLHFLKDDNPFPGEV